MSEGPDVPTLAAAPTLASALAAAAEALEAIPGTSGSETSWARGDRTFATLSDGAAEFRLDGPIAAAARRTPDTSTSSRGPEWVRFAPRALDGMAVDRARAWFEAAFRRAG